MITREVAQYLAASVSGLFYDAAGSSGNVFLGDLPTSPDGAVSVRSSGGEPNDTRLGYDTPVVQVIVRGSTPFDKTSGHDVARSIYSLLQGLTSTALPSGTWVVLSRSLQSEPSDIGQDENGRQEWSMNFILEVRSVTEHRE